MEKRGRKWSPKYTRYDVSSTLTVDTNNHGIKKETSIKFLTPGKKSERVSGIPHQNAESFPVRGSFSSKVFALPSKVFLRNIFV